MIMRKVCNIDSAEVYAQSNLLYDYKWHGNNRKAGQRNKEWLNAALTEPQVIMLESHGYALRTHPKHSPTIEVFIDERTMTETDWTMLRLLF